MEEWAESILCSWETTEDVEALEKDKAPPRLASGAWRTLPRLRFACGES